MTPLPIPDYHLHTAVTEDAESTLDEIAAAAVAAGLREIAVTNHFVVGLDTYRVTPEQLWEHRRRADELEDELGLSIKIGAEVDYFEDRLDEINEFLKSFDFDIVIGAAHFVEGLGVAAESSARELFGKYDALTVFKKSLLRIEAAAASGLFDVIAHLDIVRKFHRESDGEVRFSDYEEEAERIARALVESGTGFEVNCRGFQHATGSQYPSSEFLMLLKRYDIETVTIGSDAHKAELVGTFLSDGLAELRKAGFTHLTTYEKRRPCKTDINKPGFVNSTSNPAQCS